MPEKILVIDDEKAISDAISYILKKEYAVTTAQDGSEGLRLYESTGFDLVITDMKMDGIGGIEVLERIRKIDPEVPVILITAFGSIDSAVEAVKLGATDYITKPFVNDDLKLRVRKTLESRRLIRENSQLKAQLSEKFDFSKIIGRSDAMKTALKLLDKAIPAPSNILITGETGTGKGLLASTIHYNSPRKDRPFISVNCGAIPETLLESQLFGHKKGAFTSADRDARGLFEEADGGTLFLDEIGEMPLALQVKLLKFIQDREFTPVGGTKPVTVDVRIIAATNQNLEEMVAAHIFRQDLYYRLNVIEIELPPLRDRGYDVMLLADHFIREMNKRAGESIQGLDKHVERVFLEYGWPGNIRELHNVIERAVVTCGCQHITLANLPERFVANRHNVRSPLLKEAHEEFEATYILKVCNENGGDKELTAKILGIDLATLYRKVKKYNIKC